MPPKLIAAVRAKYGGPAESRVHTIPSWFLHHCVKTTSDLAGATSALAIRQSPDEAPSTSDSTFEIDSAFYEDLGVVLLDTAAQPPEAANQNTAFFKMASLFLTITTTRDGQGCPALFQNIVEEFCRDKNADLITLAKDDMEDLAQYFVSAAKQPVGSPTENLDHWLGNRLRGDHTFSVKEMLQLARKHKASGNSQADPTTSCPKPLVIHVPEAHRFVPPDPGVAFELLDKLKIDTTKRSFRNNILAAIDSAFSPKENSPNDILNAILGGTPREGALGGRTLLVLSSHEIDDVSELGSSTAKLLHPTAKVKLAPVRSPTQVKLLESGPPETDFRLRANVRSLQSKIRQQTGNFSDPTVQPYADWELFLVCEASATLSRDVLGDEEIADLADRIGHTLSPDHINRVLSGATRRRDLLSSWDVVDDSTGWSGFPPHVRSKILEIEGDEKRSQEAALLALLVKPGTVTHGWDDIQVDADVKDTILQWIGQANSAGRPHAGILSKAKLGGALLYGPPGTGKTHLARVVAHECKATMISATAADICTKWAGETEQAIKALFNLGRMLYPSVIFIDEADTLFRGRQDNDQSWERSQTNQFLAEVDGLINIADRPLVLLATNFPQTLDFAVLRRVPFKLYLGLPQAAARRAIFDICLRDDPTSGDVDRDDLARRTKGYSGADIQTLCYQAALICRDADVEGQNGRVIGRAHFEAALRRTLPTVTSRAWSKIRAFARENDPSAIARMDAADHGEQLRAPLLAGRCDEAIPAELQGPPIGAKPNGRAQTPPPQTRADDCPISQGNFPSGDTVGDEPAPLYTPLERGSKQIRVLSIQQSPDGLLGWKLETVDLGDEEPWYHNTLSPTPGRAFAFHRFTQLPEFMTGARDFLWPSEGDDEIENAAAAGMAKLQAVEKLEEAKDVRPRFRWGDYIAMSYTWGNHTPKNYIRVNGQKFAVSPNLYSVLRALVSSYEVQTLGLKIWIDAVCINQNDRGERETEIWKMSLIYSKARAVRAWLEPPPTDSFSRQCREVRDVLDEGQVLDLDDDALFDHPSKHALSAVGSTLLTHPYWDRAWIVQEIALAASVVFWYGGTYFTPGEVMQLTIVSAYKGGTVALPDTSVLTDMFRVYKVALRLGLFGWSGSKERVVGKVVNVARVAEASDARDKVYGMLALIPDSISARIQALYTRTFWDACADFTRAYILDTGNLRIWHGQVTMTTFGDPRLPSWALDLYEKPRESGDDFSQWATIQTYSMSFEANGTKRCTPTFSQDGRIMFCPGVFVDSIQSLAKTTAVSRAKTAWDFYFKPTQTELPPTAGAAAAATSAQPLPPVDESSKSALARVLHKDSDYQYPARGCLLDLPWGLEGDQPPDGLTWKQLHDTDNDLERALALASLPSFRAMLHANADFHIHGVPLRAYFDSPAGAFDTGSSTRRALSRVAVGGRLCMTTAGRVGMVPDETRIGDRIAVLYACDMPVVVRRQEGGHGHYQLVGCCYIDGLMKGEGLNSPEEMISFS
ncbi:hypothetical protein MAPG_09344 [Magnaporthiopsis poae ATCC 64411]|uniref:AAA+ ATPase domain-containing protein n=1 Tax=Magnaporthiopsis poae (strain ATCC 64411 / 73-15) TaxID=644358 RepID=A0A0C4E9P8_MAGP6|nr:hypothetical protein MAPG_09344 [Magnaporthiopsis poae ATCC 64411]